ncbi:MAG: transcriptional regulator NrdR [Patescibacteria group bacterium]
MQCPACGFGDTKVVDSRTGIDGISIRRRRECLKCEFRFSTNEQVEILDLSVIKRDGSKESYSKEKVESGLRRALEKRPITKETFQKLMSGIERDIQVKAKGSEITSQAIGELVMKHLRKTDKVAYIRFASVYQSFQDAQTFQKELEKLLSHRRQHNKP